MSGTEITGAQSCTVANLAVLLAAALLASACAVGNRRPLPEPCVTTHDQGCLSFVEFEERATALAEDFRTETSFSNQWGLATINADRAYANLALAEGDDQRPGAGQTIGMIDTGIDEEHLLFHGMAISEEFLEGASDEPGMISRTEQRSRA